MRKKLVGIFVCMLMITTCAIPVYGTIRDFNIKKSSDTPDSFNKDYVRTPLHKRGYVPVSSHKDPVQTPLYSRSLQDIISGKPLPSLEGSRPLLVILTSFIDENHNASHNVDYFDKMLFGPRPSLSDYYSEVSYGKFTYSRAGVLDWHKIYVTKEWADDVNNTWKFAAMTINAADKGFNFASYDINNDGVVTDEELSIFIVHSGFSDWAWHMWTVNIRTNDGVLVEGEYSIGDEWCPLGIFAHELGHGFLLPDLYDLDFDSNGTGQYCLMSSGGEGYIHMSAWCKIQLGWIIPTVITTNGTYTLHDAETHSEALIVCDLKHSGYEYFLIENRYKGTSYDSISGEWYDPVYQFWCIGDLPDEGILIYHIDDRKAIPCWSFVTGAINNDEEHKAVDVECSDSPSSHFIDADDLDSMKNWGDDTDLWDSTTYDFDDFSSPCNATWYDGKLSGCAIRDFSAIGPTMTMNISINSKIENHPPADLSITGPASGTVGTPYEYSYRAKDPENQYIFYYIDWGDETSTGWIG